MLCLIIISCSDQEIKQKLFTQPIDIQSKNPKAIEFFKDAKLKLFNGEEIEAKQGFLSALRLDPDFLMANIDINEDNIKLKQSFTNKAKNSIQKSNEFEKLYFIYKTTSSRFEKRKIAQQIIEKYPNNYEGYIMEGLTHSWWAVDTEEAQNLFKKAIEVDPNNLYANFNIVEYKYNGAPTAFSLRNDIEFYKSFNKDASDLINKFPDNISVLSRMALIYRNSMIVEDESRYKKSLDLY
jgi:tetratricopeptide (TPR) repeat protein